VKERDSKTEREREIDGRALYAYVNFELRKKRRETERARQTGRDGRRKGGRGRQIKTEEHTLMLSFQTLSKLNISESGSPKMSSNFT